MDVNQTLRENARRIEPAMDALFFGGTVDDQIGMCDEGK